METSGVTGTNNSQNPEFVDKDKTGFNGLTSEHFLKLLITQLQNQDPLEPLGNEELLNQLTSMRALQSNLELTEALESITLTQRLSAGANFIGKEVTGLTKTQKEVTGVVQSVIVRNGETVIKVGEDDVPIENITSVNYSDPE